MKDRHRVDTSRTLKVSMYSSVCLPLILILPFSGCSKSGPSTGAAVSKITPAAAGTLTGNACDRNLITSADAVGVLGKPVVSEKTLPGDAQTCVFTTADFTTLTISLRPGLGQTTVDAWATGKMSLPVTTVSGVGERAVWQSTLKEINAEKNNLLCDIGVVGPARIPGATPEKLGALCNKIYAKM